MKRRDVISTAGLAAAATLGAPGSVGAQNSRHLTMVTDWPEGPGILPSARRLARTIVNATNGRIRIEVTRSGAVVRPFETFDAVQSGVADMFHSHIGYFEKKSPAFHFFSGMPFGLTANELFAWVRFGGGQQFFDELGARFNIKPLLCCSTGSQMGGWFVREVDTTEAFRGLRYRMAGLGGEVFRRLGATVVNVPGADIVLALRSGAIDACEWVGPWLDTQMGLHEAAEYYYYPAWQEPGTAITVGINKVLWDSFDESDRYLIEAAAASEFTVSLAEFNIRNAAALDAIRKRGTVKIRRFDQKVLETFADISRDVKAEAGSVDELSRSIHRSYTQFQKSIRTWSDVAECAYLAIGAVDR